MKRNIITTFALMLATPALAGPVAELTQFAPNTPARAAEVNANFTAVKTAVDDNASRIAALEATIVELQGIIDDLTTEIDDRQSAIDFANDLRDVTHVHTRRGQPSVSFSGVNVYVDNGSGASAVADGGITNGVGNLIIGYNEVGASTKTGSHNVIIGPRHFYTSELGIISGTDNLVTAPNAAVIGGIANAVEAESSIIAGGNHNTVDGNNSAVVASERSFSSGSFTAVIASLTSRVTGAESFVASSVDSSATFLNTTVLGSRNGHAKAQQSGVLGKTAVIIPVNTECNSTWLNPDFVDPLNSDCVILSP